MKWILILISIAFLFGGCIGPLAPNCPPGKEWTYDANYLGDCRSTPKARAKLNREKLDRGETIVVGKNEYVELGKGKYDIRFEGNKKIISKKKPESEIKSKPAPSSKQLISWRYDVKAALNEAKKKKQPALVYFRSTDKHSKNIDGYFAKPIIAKDVNSRFQPVAISINWNRMSKEPIYKKAIDSLVKFFNIKGVPTIIFYDGNGKHVGRRQGDFNDIKGFIEFYNKGRKAVSKPSGITVSETKPVSKSNPRVYIKNDTGAKVCMKYYDKDLKPIFKGARFHTVCVGKGYGTDSSMDDPGIYMLCYWIESKGEESKKCKLIDYREKGKVILK